ncbi:MAG: type VI secretion system accessory protein TagJ [Proteobacteria bacterium]|nr:type VI secretion system accessory protein TagJ [Pseudomonadota bacterium]
MSSLLAESQLNQGNLPEALTSLQEQIRKDPSNAKLRAFLFQLLSVLGQWERALTQLKVVGELDASFLLMAQTYREAIMCEVLRAKVFAGTSSPLIFGDPQQWVALLVEGLRLDAEGHHQEAKTLRYQSFELAPATSGIVNGVSFQWIADGDSRLGPVLDAVVNGRYYWIPFQQIRKIEIEEPADLRDVVWMPAQFTWANGGSSSGLIPTRYPGSENSKDSMIQLGRKTEWEEFFEGAYRGTGQRILTTDSEEYGIMDARQIELNMKEE